MVLSIVDFCDLRGSLFLPLVSVRLRERLLLEHGVLDEFVVVLVNVQLSSAFLQLVDAPLDLGKLPLGV